MPLVASRDCDWHVCDLQLQLTFAHLPHVDEWAHTGFQCLFGCLGMMFMASVRASGEVGVGILTSVVYAIAMTTGQFETSVGKIWSDVGSKSYLCSLSLK
jgi:hypothetical protein